jgi:hypothetical protein
MRTSGAGRVITMAKTQSARGHRASPYFWDEALVRGKRTAAGVIWRFRTETTLLATTSAGVWELARTVTLTWALVTLAATAAAMMVLPWTRRFLVVRAWCVLTRHRIQKACWELRMHTRSGRLPLVLRIYPTQVGVRALIWCRAGICAADFEESAKQIAAACYARQARVEGSQRWARLVQLDIVRRDTLGAAHVIPSGIARLSPKRRQAS